MKGETLAWARYMGQGVGGLQAGCRLENGCLHLLLATSKYNDLNIYNMVEEEYDLGRSVRVGN